MPPAVLPPLWSFLSPLFQAFLLRRRLWAEHLVGRRHSEPSFQVSRHVFPGQEVAPAAAPPFPPAWACFPVGGRSVDGLWGLVGGPVRVLPVLCGGLLCSAPSPRGRDKPLWDALAHSGRRVAAFRPLVSQEQPF